MSESRRAPVLAVGAVVWNAKGECVLVRRGRPPRKDEWSIPGGKVEWGETVREALLREIREETGLAVEIGMLIGAVDSLVRDSAGRLAHHHLLLDFTAQYVSGELLAGDDVREARWVPAARLDDYPMWHETRRVVELSRDGLGKGRRRGRRSQPAPGRTRQRPKRG